MKIHGTVVLRGEENCAKKMYIFWIRRVRKRGREIEKEREGGRKRWSMRGERKGETGKEMEKRENAMDKEREREWTKISERWRKRGERWRKRDKR